MSKTAPKTASKTVPKTGLKKVSDSASETVAKIGMIPARMGSQRLKQRNLQPLGGGPLITRAIRKCKESGVFDEIWVNSEHPAFGEIAGQEGVKFHRRPHRYLAIRILRKQGSLFADGSDRRPFAIVTNLPDNGLELIRWHRKMAGSIEHSHDILTNELAAEALPSQKSGANAAWVRLNVILYNLLAALKRLALPADLRTARPKRLRFLLFNTIGRVVRHARETLLRLSSALAKHLFDTARVKFHALSPPLPAE